MFKRLLKLFQPKKKTMEVKHYCPYCTRTYAKEAWYHQHLVNMHRETAMIQDFHTHEEDYL